MEAQEFGYFSPEKRLSDTKTTGDNFIVEDLLDFSNNEGIIADGTFDSITGGNSTDSSTVTLVDSCNSSFSAGNDPHFISSGGCGGDVGIRSFATTDTQFSGELCVPYEDLAELEWLSNFVEESFPSEDLEKLQLISGISGIKTGPEALQYQPDPAGNTTSADSSSDANANINNNSPIFSPEMPVPGKARSKRSRAAPCNWTSRLLALSPNAAQTQTHTQSQQTSSSESDKVSAMGPKSETKPGPKKKGSSDPAGANGEGRKCLHCATDKTPQWRTGPMGPKTLCNACGVRYKSGRLVPEYRPAASPTFVQTKHSNSHRKVMELRRQKELMRQQQLGQQEQQQQQFIHGNLMFDGSNQDDYLIHQHIGPDFRQLI